jgi:hypothetical protein
MTGGVNGTARPVITLAGRKFGLSPLLQWIVVPAFAFTRRVVEKKIEELPS